MSLNLRWVGQDEVDRVAETRMLCSGHARNELPRYKAIVAEDLRAKAGDYLLAERNGRAVGTATSLSMRMWLRGSVVPCQGVAWVGAVKTERRKAQGGGSGVASSVMREMLRKARERQEVVSALMPFRATFYEHFGYGLVERRCDWTVPLNLLPSGDCAGMRFMEAGDRGAMIECWQRVTERGQCDVERMPEAWERFFRTAESGLIVVDRPSDSGPVRGWAHVVFQPMDGRSVLRVGDNWVAEGPDAFRRMLCFLGSLRDQYSAVTLTLPVDLPLNWVLRETQIPHRPVVHATAEVRPYTRMQLRVLDHRRFLEGMKLNARWRGSCVVAVRETEGEVSKFRIELADGRVSVAVSEASADVECADRVWASVACGDLSSRQAAELGVMQINQDQAQQVLEAFSVGPAPFCREYF